MEGYSYDNSNAGGEVRETQVGSALNTLEVQCEELSASVSRLEGRLSHVRQERPEKTTGSPVATPGGGGVPMAQRLAKTIDFVRNITNRLGSLERELEI